MSLRTDRAVLLGLQVLVLGVPLLVGGTSALVLELGVPLVLVLLGLTVVARVRRSDVPPAPGVLALAAFAGLGLAATVPVSPAVLDAVAPATARLYRDTLPGWPGAGGWALWRPVAWDPWAAAIEVLRLALAFGAFTVTVAYPWGETRAGEPGRQHVIERLFATVLLGGLVFALLGLLEQVAGNGQVLWVTEAPASGSRLAGPFVNPNHFAAWLEMILPAATIWALVVARRVCRRLGEAVTSGRAVGVNARRAWASAVLANQRRLWPPLAAGLAVTMLLGAHLATDSRGGRLALTGGLAFTALGLCAARRTGRWRRLGSRLALPLALGVLLAGAGVFALLARAASDEAGAAEAVDVDVDIGSRLAVAASGIGVVLEHPLVGTGLGSWLHAFRPHQAPPVEDGIWDHAHDDYLELTAETGLLGAALATLFAVCVLRAVRSGEAAVTEEPAERLRRAPAPPAPGFEEGDWRRALGDRDALRWGLAGGVVAILVHSFVDFGLRMPGNLVLLMTLLGILVLLGHPAGRRRCRLAPAALCALVAAAAAVPLANAVRLWGGDLPLAPGAALELADARLSEDDDRDAAVRLVHWAIERAPADRDAHRQLAAALGPGDEAEAALRRAIALEPWAAELRDELGLSLWQRGRQADAAVELEEAMFRWPHLETHAYLSPDGDVVSARSLTELLREITDGETLEVRLALLDPTMASAVERGLRRALDESPGGETRWLIAQDLIELLEARGRWAEAARVLRAEGELRADDTELLARAARDYLQAGDGEGAEAVLLRAIARAPQHGALYRTLAVRVYAARSDFVTAELVLESGSRNATDVMPVYHGITEVLARREATREYAALPPLPVDDVSAAARPSPPGADTLAVRAHP